MPEATPSSRGVGVTGVPVAAALFLISAAVLALQVLQTRILSVQMWHHHSYMVVTMTLLGFAAAGSLVTVRPGLARGNVAVKLGVACHLFFVTTILGYFLLARTADAAAEMTASGQYFSLSLFYSYLLLPYFFGGLVVTIALSGAKDVHGLYFVNLAGSAVGAWVFIAVITPLGGERLLVLSAAMGALAGFVLLARQGAAGLLGSLGVLGVAGVLFAGAPKWLAVGVASNKAMTDALENIEGSEVVHTAWTPLCRLDFVRFPDVDEATYPMNVYQDGDAITVMHSDASFAPLEPFPALNTLAYEPHKIRFEETGERPKALAIGIGGGIDLRYGLASEAESVLGIEINSETVRLMREDFADWNGDIYHRRIDHGGGDVQEVEVRVGEGRSTLRRLEEKFDVIELSGTDTYTAGNSGAYVLSESYLYTAEALGEYFDHLNPGGTLGMIRLAYDPPRENLRLFAIALLELRERGVERPSEHGVVIFHEQKHDSGQIIRFSGNVYSVDPLPEEAIALYRQADLVPEFRVLYYPGIELDNPFTRLARAIDEGTEQEFFDAYYWDVSPVDDDSPFFFNFHHWSALLGDDERGASDWHDLTGGPIGLRILGTLLLQTTVLTALLVILPLIALRKGLASSNAGRHLVYFLGLGAGFMFLEISTVQRLVLFLGHPTYSLTVTLSCFLFFAGLGSLWSRRYRERPGAALRVVVVALAVFIAVYAVALEPILAGLLHLSLPVRIACCVVLLAPMNFLMGMPFPLGLARLQRLAPPLVPWALGANGGASVIGSILCIVVAMESGFRAVSLTAMGIYLVGMLVVTTGPLAPSKSGG